MVRTAIEALAGVLGGTNSLHTNALDETLALPSEQAAEIALRTQQVIMDEIGVTNVADPLGGSWYLEALTDQIEAEANCIFDKILSLGGSTLTHNDTEALARSTADKPITKGLLRGIEDGWFMSEIADAAFNYQRALEKGEKLVVGVNTHLESVSAELDIMRVSHEVETEQVALLRARKAARDEAAVQAALGETPLDAVGREVLREQVKISGGTWWYALAVGKFAAGNYTLVVGAHVAKFNVLP